MRSRVFVEQERHLLDRVREAVHNAEPSAEVVLYGSRARGEAQPDSDWDLLVLIDGALDYRRAEAVQDRLFDLAVETDVVLSVVVHTKREWESSLYRATPFHAEVEREGITL